MPGFNFNPTLFLGFMLGFVIGTTLHEFMHAYSAYRLGDDTAARMGRITLNPFAHFDPLGFFMGVLLALGVGFIAWGRPVPVNPYALKGGRRGMAIVAFAGPVANLALAAALLPLYNYLLGLVPDGVTNLAECQSTVCNAVLVVQNMISINLVLFAFNLIPIPPLDGFNILSGILPNYWVVVMEPIRRYSLPILLGVVFVVPLVGRMFRIELNPVYEALDPIITGLGRIFLG